MKQTCFCEYKEKEMPFGAESIKNKLPPTYKAHGNHRFSHAFKKSLHCVPKI